MYGSIVHDYDRIWEWPGLHVIKQPRHEQLELITADGMIVDCGVQDSIEG
jgi:hypothetical protein